MIVNQVFEAFAALSGIAYFLAPDGELVLAAVRGVPESMRAERRVLPLDAPLPLATAIRTGRSIWLESLDALLEAYPGLRQSKTPSAMLQSVVALPLVVHDRSVGGIGFSFGAPRTFDEDDRRFFETLARHAALAVERAELRRQEERARTRLTILAEATRRFAEARLELRDTLDTIAREVAARLGDSCAINLLSADGTVLEPAVVAHLDPEIEASTRRTMADTPVRVDGDSSLARVARTGEPIHIPHVQMDVLLSHSAPAYRAHLERYPIGSLMVVPLRARSVTIGTITTSRGPAGPAYGRDDQLLLQDLADRAGLAVANARQHEELAAAIAARDDFLSIAGHELRTPLTALQLQIQGIKRMAEKDDALARVLERIVKTEAHVTRLEKLIFELLDVSRMSAGRLAIEREPMDLMATVREVIDRLAPQAASAGCTVTLEGPERIAGSWDRPRLEQVITNLLGNSIKYGSGAPIEVTTAVVDGHADVRVRDHGIGIGPDDEERVFGRFERAVPERHYGGLGLGLWIAREIVEAHGGTIRFERPADAGTRFVVELPFEVPS